jgi:hypothetical protein
MVVAAGISPVFNHVQRAKPGLYTRLVGDARSGWMAYEGQERVGTPLMINHGLVIHQKL